MDSLQSLIGHRFSDLSLMEEALTHGSLAHEGQRIRATNQRLEFLGDAVLQLTLSESLFRQLGKADEGVLTKLRAQLVSTKALARIARQLNLGKFLSMGRGEAAHGGRDRDSTLADALEALAAAIYLDGGISASQAFAKRIFQPEIQTLLDAPVESNPKGQLQELLQAHSNNPPTYQIVAEAGPDHSKIFEATVLWNKVELGRGSGSSKKEAQSAAAQDALKSRVLQQLLSSGSALSITCESSCEIESQTCGEVA
jgi:ribonuclease-3